MNKVEVICCKGNGCNHTDEVESLSHVKYHHWMRHDYHGICTGLYCDDCYENNYPYKRGDYTHGTGVADDGTPIESNH